MFSYNTNFAPSPLCPRASQSFRRPRVRSMRPSRRQKESNTRSSVWLGAQRCSTKTSVNTTRKLLKRASRKAFRVWSSPKFHKLHLMETRRECRTPSRPSRRVTLNPHHDASHLLENIDFVKTGAYIAKTDGQRISLNANVLFTLESLYWTLLHEIMHDTFLFRGEEISEEKEHRVMARIDKNLVCEIKEISQIRWSCR